MTREFDFFVRRGISGPKPAPIVGNMWGIWKRDALDYDHEMTKKYGKTFGVFDGSLPNLVTSDADMVRFLLVKGFDHFVNRRDFGGIVNIKYFRKMLTVTQNQEWKDIRSAVTPTFTSGKIKRMSSLITKCTEELVAVLTTEAQNGGRLDAKKQDPACFQPTKDDLLIDSNELCTESSASSPWMSLPNALSV